MVQTTWTQDEAIGEIIEEVLNITGTDWSGLVAKVANLFNPEDFYSASDLAAWAESNGYIHKDDVAYGSPDDYFSPTVLRDWAESNGYVLEE